LKELIKAIILPVVLGVLGMYFTHTYNAAKLKADYAKTIHDYLPEIQSDDLMVSQAALEILRPILTPEQEKAISRVIKGRQKTVIDQADLKADITIAQIQNISKINPEDGAELKSYAVASELHKEGLEFIVEGNYKKAAEKLEASSSAHPDFDKSAKFAKLIEDSLVNRPDFIEREAEVLDAIVSNSKDLPFIGKQKINERSMAIQEKRDVKDFKPKPKKME